MISVIICSTDPQRFAAVESTYTAAMGQEPWELIGIHDAKSPAEGYTRGVAASKGEIVVFSHDDIAILSPDLPARLKKYVASYDLIGVAGTLKLVSPIWFSHGPPYLVGQVANTRPDGAIDVNIFGVPRRIVGGIQAMEGLFLAARRSVLSQVEFDATTFDGLHLYDIDLTYGAYSKGLRLAVANDISLLRTSVTKSWQEWDKYAKRFEQKWLANVAPPPTAALVGRA